MYANIKENINGPHYWSFVRWIHGDRWGPPTKRQRKAIPLLSRSAYTNQAGHPDTLVTENARVGRATVHYTDDFCIEIRIRWEIRFIVIPFLFIISLQNFAHATSAVLFSYVQNCVDVRSLTVGWERNELSGKFKLLWKPL